MTEKELQMTQMMLEIKNELEQMKKNLPNGELRIIQLNIEELKNSQADLKRDMSDIKRKLLDPDDGVIVKVNENTKFRLQKERSEKKYEDMLLEHAELVKWKGTVTKVLWMIFSALIGILSKMFFLDK
jgi:hypothetical protein